MIVELLKELDALRQALVDDSDVDVLAVDALLTRVRAAAAGSTEAEISKLNEAVLAGEEALRTRYERVGSELKRLKRGRTALQGYNHLRGFDQGQRLFRQA